MASARPELTGVVVRPAVRADLPALAELWFAFETWLNAFEAEPQPVDRIKFEGFQSMAFAESPACFVLLAEVDGRAVGYLVHYPGVWMDDMAPCLHIADLFVHPDAHRYGIGRALMNSAAEIARATYSGPYGATTRSLRHSTKAWAPRCSTRKSS